MNDPPTGCSAPSPDGSQFEQHPQASRSRSFEATYIRHLARPPFHQTGRGSTRRSLIGLKAMRPACAPRSQMRFRSRRVPYLRPQGLLAASHCTTRTSLRSTSTPWPVFRFDTRTAESEIRDTIHSSSCETRIRLSLGLIHSGQRRRAKGRRRNRQPSSSRSVISAMVFVMLSISRASISFSNVALNVAPRVRATELVALTY